jgi:anti-sigma factor RsiW
MATEWSTGDASEVCELFQLDLSCLVDGELDEPAAARALVHLETCEMCREFFEDTRRCLRLHRDVSDPSGCSRASPR